MLRGYQGDFIEKLDLSARGLWLPRRWHRVPEHGQLPSGECLCLAQEESADMWTARKEAAPSGILKITIERDACPMPYLDALRRMQHDADFRTYFIDLLADAPFAAFRWETPPITGATASRKFEFVLLDSPGLAQMPDGAAFSEHFQANPDADVVEFANLGKDAILVVPTPKGPGSVYGHLAAFVRQAPELQKHALWATVGAAMERRLGSKPVWLSTAGAGVAWLHVRLDDRPKYYGYAPYRKIT